MTGFLANALTRSLAKIFRDRASLTSVARLKKEGYRTVSVLQISHLEELIGAAIEKVMMETVGDPAKGRRLARGAQMEFLRMLGERNSLERATSELKGEQEELRRNTEKLKEEIRAARGELQKEAREASSETLSDISHQLDAEFESILREAVASGKLQNGATHVLEAATGSIRERVLALIGEALHRQPPTVVTEESGSRVVMLEKRLAKLNAALDEANSMLDRLRATKGSASDDGVASVYKEVQGLSGAEQKFEERSNLMRAIFQLNLELRQEIENQ